MKDWIATAYHWFWFSFLCRQEPFTYQFRRMATKYPKLWVILLAGSIIASFAYATFRERQRLWLRFIVASAWTVFAVWLALHIGGIV